jgi:two-component system phosphate regulon sensor histidine kinase PhoR
MATGPAPGGPAGAAPRGRRASVSHAAKSALYQELLKVLTLTVLGALFGWWMDHAAVGASFALLIYLLMHLRYLRALRLWLEDPKHHELPEPDGIWGEVFERLLDLQRRNRKRKKKLAAIVAEFQASTAALPDGAVVLAERGEIAWFNKAAQALLGLRTHEDFGIRITNLIRHPRFTDYMDVADYERDVEVPSPVNRAISLSLKVIPYGIDQRLLIVRDVSELRRLERARRDFVANASHELRTPLTVLRGYLDVIEPETRDRGSLATWRMPVAEMRSQATRMELLINDMLKLAKLESDVETRQDVLDVPTILDRVMDDARAISKERHQFQVRIERDLFVYGRDVEMQSIFSNLVSNAVRYTPDGGDVRVEWVGDTEGAHFSVSDTGIGISEQDLPRLTERFYRVDVGRSRASGGTGLGLSIVKHALERHEGRLEISSRLGEGSTFICHFPAHRVHRAETPPEKKALAG